MSWAAAPWPSLLKTVPLKTPTSLPGAAGTPGWCHVKLVMVHSFCFCSFADPPPFPLAVPRDWKSPTVQFESPAGVAGAASWPVGFSAGWPASFFGAAPSLPRVSQRT